MDRLRPAMSDANLLPPELVATHAASLRALARSLALDEHAADDVVQETWLRALSSPPARLDGIGGWLRRVAEGFALKRHRGEGRRADRERQYALVRTEAVSGADTRADTLRAVVDAVLSLEEPYRETVLLRWFEGLPPRDIAARQRTSVATVNSRLQRGHALLRERLARRLDLDERGLQGVLLALFGVGTARTAVAATSLSLAGVTVTTTTKLISAAGTAALALCAFLYFSGREEPHRPPPSAADARAVELEAGAPIADRAEAGASRVELQPPAPLLASEPVPAIQPGPFEFDLTVVPIDATGRPLSDVEVRVGLPLQRTALLGVTAWDGELHTTWRGSEPALDLVLDVSAPNAQSSPLRRVHLVAGSPQTIVLAVDSERPPGTVTFRWIVLSGVRAASAPPNPPRFTRDEAGNGVFIDPWLLGGEGTQAAPDSQAAAMSARIDQIRFTAHAAIVKEAAAKTSVNSHVGCTVRDEAGHLLPDTLVTVLAEGQSGRWETNTNSEGRVDFEIPVGRIIVFAGGGDRVLVREALELEPEHPRALDVTCPLVEKTRVRLLDHAGQPLAGWHVEGRQTDANGTLADRGDTDEGGHVALFVPQGGPIRILARPASAPRAPKLVLEDPLFTRRKETDLTVRGDASRSTLSVAITGPSGCHVGETEVRAWRTDSREGMRMGSVEVSDEAEGIDQRALFRCDDLVPGEYLIEYGARASGWKTVGPFFLKAAQQLDAGSYALDGAALLTVDEKSASHATLTISTRVQGLSLQSEPVAAGLPAEFRLPGGKWTLSTSLAASADSTKSLQSVRAIHASPGQRLKPETPADPQGDLHPR